MKKTLKPSEHDIQSAIVEWCRWNEKKYPALKRLHKITNEGSGSAARGKRMKEEGLRAGVSDLFLAYPIEKPLPSLAPSEGYWPFCGLYLEIKAPGKKPNKEQMHWILESGGLGYKACWCDSVDEGVGIIQDYLGIKE